MSSGARAEAAFFEALRQSVQSSADWCHLHWPGAATALTTDYGLAQLGRVLDQVEEIREYFSEDGTEKSVVLPKTSVIPRIKEGLTLICNGLEEADPISAARAVALRAALGGDGRTAARIFYTNALRHAYGMHLDPFFTLTLQVSGRKLWKIARRREAIDCRQLHHSILAPAPGAEVHYPCGRIVGPDPFEWPFSEVMLEPGDALLIAPGVWHHVIPVDESFSVALDVMPPDQPRLALEIGVIRHPD